MPTSPLEDFVVLISEDNPRCKQAIGNMSKRDIQHSVGELNLPIANGEALYDKESGRIYECPFVCRDGATICVRFARISSGGQGRVQMIVVDFSYSTSPEVSCKLWSLSTDTWCSLRKAIIPNVIDGIEKCFGVTKAKIDGAGPPTPASYRDGLRSSLPARHAHENAQRKQAANASASKVVTHALTRASAASLKRTRFATTNHPKPIAAQGPLKPNKRKKTKQSEKSNNASHTKIREPLEPASVSGTASSIAESAPCSTVAPKSSDSNPSAMANWNATDSALVAQFLAAPEAKRLVIRTAAGSDFIFSK